MFTGIVVEQGSVKRTRARRGLLELEVEAPGVAKELAIGDSVSVNGVCLTATRGGRRRFQTEAMEETLARSTLGSLRRGSSVNLELAARLSDRLGGHLVQGHVDGVAKAVRVEEQEGARRVWFSAPAELLRYMVRKGSVTLDGVSLTVVDVGETTFQVALIPHTLAATTLGSIDKGAEVNLEVDVVAKYVERLVGGER
ncbi:MAG: riboflavin synthase [Actinomycetota bacterium]|nr:riboflavin synthase [Actinomycetota bacterium]